MIFHSMCEIGRAIIMPEPHVQVAYLPSCSTYTYFPVKVMFLTMCCLSQITPPWPSYNPWKFVVTVLYTQSIYKVFGLIFFKEYYLHYLTATVGADYYHVCTCFVQSYVSVSKAVLDTFLFNVAQ